MARKAKGNVLAIRAPSETALTAAGRLGKGKAKARGKVLFIRVPSELHRRFKILAVREGVSLQDLLSDLISARLYEITKQKKARAETLALVAKLRKSIMEHGGPDPLSDAELKRRRSPFFSEAELRRLREGSP